MARARLYLICGNCGCSDMFTWKYIKEHIDDETLVTDEDVFISCGNCSTLHSLNNNAERNQDI